MDKATKKEIIQVLKTYKDMSFLLEQLNRSLEYCTDERREVRILNTIAVITRDRNIINTALASLKDKHREAFELKFVQGYNAEEAGRIMHRDRSAIYNYIDDIVQAVYNEILAQI